MHYHVVVNGCVGTNRPGQVGHHHHPRCTFPVVSRVAMHDQLSVLAVSTLRDLDRNDKPADQKGVKYDPECKSAAGTGNNTQIKLLEYK